MQSFIEGLIMRKSQLEWSIDDIRQLQGQLESPTLRFIESKVFQKPQRALKTLAKNISAFANAEGGSIVIGMKAKRSRPPVALEIDSGIDPQQFPLERLQQAVSTCISPALPDICCSAIPVADAPASRVVYVISVPKGYTAHQASDYIYYTRNGAVTEPMPAHLVRLLTLRNGAPRALLDIGNCDILNKEHHNEYRFDLLVHNIGGTTLRDFLITLCIKLTDRTLQMWAPTMFVDNEETIVDELKSVESLLEIGDDVDVQQRHDILHGPGIPFQSGDRLRCSFQRILQLLYQVRGKAIFPHDQIVFPGGKWLIEGVPADVSPRSYKPTMEWTIYMDNAEPCSGCLDLSDRFEDTEREALALRDSV
jgi:hypothetical protein